MPDNQTRLMIGILSCEPYVARREGCMATWVNDAKDAGIPTYFMVGNGIGVAKLCDELTVQVPSPDDYVSLPRKVGEFFNWALENFNFDYLFKCDDDTYVSIPRLAHYPFADREYVGSPIRGYASGGAGYLLSRRAVKIAADLLLATATGYEDKIVGAALRREGIRLCTDWRFCRRNNVVPLPTNYQISSHYIDSARMRDIHRRMSLDARATSSRVCDFTMRGWFCAYGEIGLRGERGFVVDGDSQVMVPPKVSHMAGESMLSAHADSDVDIEAHRPLAISGFVDAAGIKSEPCGLEFILDGSLLVRVDDASKQTQEFMLPPGRHRLSVRCRGSNVRRYSVWSLRAINNTVRIVMPTSDRYTRSADTSVALIERYWPQHPEIDIVRHRVGTSGTTRQFFSGEQRSVSWCESLLWHLEVNCRDEFVILLLDDYGMCAPPRMDSLNQSLGMLSSDINIAAIYQTWMMLPSRERVAEYPGYILWPKWKYSIHTQAGVWRRSQLARLLRILGKASIEDFELVGSRIYNSGGLGEVKLLGVDIPDPPRGSLFLDETEKSLWSIPYHNLMRRGHRDDRHHAFLQSEGLEIWMP